LTSRGEPRRWLLVVIRACLRTWPRAYRDRDGAALMCALEEELLTERKGALGRTAWAAGECVSIVATGLGMRVRALTRGAAAGVDQGSRDVRLALRALVRSPVYAMSVILSLAVGVGGSGAVVGLVDRVLVPSVPFPDADRLLVFWLLRDDDPGRFRLSASDAARLNRSLASSDGIGFMGAPVDGALEDAAAAAVSHVRVAPVSSDFFSVLGVEPSLGRAFAPEDGSSFSELREEVRGEEDRAPTSMVLLGDGVWRSAFGADPGVVGRTAILDGAPVRVMGVLPPGFRVQVAPDVGMEGQADIWRLLRTPLASARGDRGRRLDQDSDDSGMAIGRLRPGATLDDVLAELRDLPESAVAGDASLRPGERVTARPMLIDARAHATPLMRSLLVGAAILLMVAIMNVSTLILARSLGRKEELALRIALGAGRGRIVLSLLAETLLLVSAGLATAWAVAPWGAGLLVRSLPSAPALATPRPGSLALAVGIAATLVLAVGVLPAVGLGLRESVAAGAALRRGPGRDRARTIFAGGQIALSTALLVAALLVLRSGTALARVDPGFEADKALSFRVSLRVPGRYPGPADRARLVRRLETALADLPGVEAVGAVGVLPLAGGRWTQPYGLPGQPEHEWEENLADFRVATSGYFEAAGIRLVEGRAFSPEEDLSEERRVVVVDERLARRMAGEGSAVGLEIGIPLDGAAVRGEVVGVVAHVRYDDLSSEGREAIYVPYRQEASRDLGFVLRYAGDSGEVAAAVRAVVRSVDPQIPVHGLAQMGEYIAREVAPTRFAMRLLALFALLTLLASAIGLYGVVAYDVRRRRKEIGVRMAVGASRERVRRTVLVQGLKVGITGVAAGGAAALTGAHFLRPILYETGVFDPVSYLAAGVIVLGLTALGAWIPARRAASLQPTEALRVE
jgi:putative ABC transport system permease protein